MIFFIFTFSFVKMIITLLMTIYGISPRYVQFKLKFARKMYYVLINI